MVSATEILKKHNVKPNKSARAKHAVELAVKNKAVIKKSAKKLEETAISDKGKVGFVESMHPIKEGSRASLMAQVREKGVKNFRILNKQELIDVLKNIGDQKAVDAIVAGAVARWKSGWGSRAREAGKDHKE